MSSSQRGRLLAEGAVIVVSILAAFALDTWWDGRQAAAEEQRVLAGLAEEFRVARKDLERQKDTHQRILQAIELVSDGVSDGFQNGVGAVAFPDMSLALLYIPPTTQLVLGTLNGLVASAGLGVIDDPELRDALATWGNGLAELTEEEWSGRELALNEMGRVFRERVDVTPFRNLGLPIVRNAVTPEQALGQSTIPIDTDLVGILATRRMVQDHLVNDEFDPVFEEIDSILALIDRNLKGDRIGEDGETQPGL